MTSKFIQNQTTKLLAIANQTGFPAHKALSIEKVQLINKKMKLTVPFETSFGRFPSLIKIFILITFRTSTGSKIRGLGECTPLPYPWYDGESDATVHTVLTKYIVPALKKSKPITNINDSIDNYKSIVGHNMAKCGVEGAYWDAVGQLLNKPVAELWGGTRTSVDSGTSVGLEPTDAEILKKIDLAVNLSVKRVKIKIKPGRDVLLVKSIRHKYPHLPLQVDGNAAYNLSNPDHIKALRDLDKFNLLLIEQPGPNDDRFYHSQISQQIKTPICLDESILHIRHAIEAIILWQQAGIINRLIINVKPPRVGGFFEGIKIAKVCASVGVKVWCGGMLESAVGKTANVHWSSLSAVNMPGDHVSQTAYFKHDIAKSPHFSNGVIDVPQKPGWGISDLKF